MAKGFDRLHVKSAVKSHNKFSLDGTHLTTMSFGQVVPLYAKELVAGDKFSVSANFFSRMAPLVRPTYGKFSFKTMSVFVPFHQVAYDFDAWSDGATTWEGITPSSRYINVVDYVTFVAYNASGVMTNSGATATNHDFAYTNSSGVLSYALLTDYGKFVIKVLNSLGYILPQNVDLQALSSWNSYYINQKYSIMPLLCYAKAYNDYMSQSQRFNTSALTNLLREIKYNINSSNYNSSTHCITVAGMKVIFDNIKLCYENDYFTSAWQWPNSALNVNETMGYKEIVDTGISVGGVDFRDAAVNTKDNNYLETYTVSRPGYGNGSLISLSQRSLDFLRSFDDFVRRNNYSGSRKVQNIYSRFGIKPDDYKSHYADVISTDIMPIQVGDVTATTSATGQPLGDYAGKGIMNGGKGFTYHASDRGMLMIIGWFTVQPMMAYGADRGVLRTNPLDYYTPEFDGQAIQAISYGEVFTDPLKSIATDTSLDNQVYGFTEIYNDYRFQRDLITGDFRKYNNSSPDNTWHSGRLLTAVRAAGEMVAQSSSMNTLPQYASEFQRIFSVPNVDPFYLTCQFKVSAVRPMLSLNQVPRLGEGDVNVPRNGNEIN